MISNVINNVSSAIYRDQPVSHYNAMDYLLFAVILVIGVFVRFWGLGNVGLHGDEETMAMPTLQILESGLPLLPSGMFYPRGIGQLYLMAGSVWLFGHSEWALRFPSALIGSIGIVAAFFLGKRFLSPKWNLLFVLIIALSPALIETSQTARMYIFFSTFTMLFAILIIHLEKTGAWSGLFGALVVFAIGVQFHVLMVFLLFLFFFPSLTKPSSKTLIQGISGFALGFVAFHVISSWIGAQYDIEGRLGGGGTKELSVVTALNFLLEHHLIAVALGTVSVLASIGFAIHRHKDRSYLFILGVVALVVGAVAGFFLSYHLALILGGIGVVLYLRSGGNKAPLFLIGGTFAITLTMQFYFLQQSGLFPGIRQIAGAMLGIPSVWSYLQFAQYFPGGFVLYGLPLIYAAWKLVERERIPDHFLFFVLSVWVPLFLIGFFAWYLPPRYMFASFPFFILCCVAGIAYLFDEWVAKRGGMRAGFAVIIFPLLLVAFVSPIDLKDNVNPDYSKRPDHQGAAFFMKTLDLSPGDLVLAEDVLQQTYYLGKVDYWLMSIDAAGQFVKEQDDRLYDIYTHTPLVGSGEELTRLLEAKDRGDIYIIGSGETSRNPSLYLGNRILEVIEEQQPEMLFEGRDKKTKILRIRNRSLAPSQPSPSREEGAETSSN